MKAVAFAYIEKITQASDPAIAAAGALSTLDATPQMLESVGFEKMVFEDFYEVLEELVKSAAKPGFSLNEEMLLQAFQNPESAYLYPPSCNLRANIIFRPSIQLNRGLYEDVDFRPNPA